MAHQHPGTVGHSLSGGWGEVVAMALVGRNSRAAAHGSRFDGIAASTSDVEFRYAWIGTAMSTGSLSAVFSKSRTSDLPSMSRGKGGKPSSNLHQLMSPSPSSTYQRRWHAASPFFETWNQLRVHLRRLTLPRSTFRSFHCCFSSVWFLSSLLPLLSLSPSLSHLPILRFESKLVEKFGADGDGTHTHRDRERERERECVCVCV